jgi:protein-tyrosine phosphatase
MAMKKRILMVCLGNICRSPMAKAMLIKKLQENNITWVQVDSAGTSDYHEGHKADHRTMESGLKHGIDLSAHKARQFNRQDFDKFDIIYAMDGENYSDILYQANNEEEAKKVKLILSEGIPLGNEINPGANLSVPDPWFGGEKDFEKVFAMLDKACDIIVEKLKTEEK